MTHSLPERPDMGQVKKQAKELLRDIKNGNAQALARAGIKAGRSFALNDAQRVIARELGFPSWAQLKQHLDAQTRIGAAEALLGAVLGGRKRLAAALLARDPTLAASSLHIACALGDPAAIQAFLEKDPALAKSKGGPRKWEPLIYLCFARAGAGDAPRAEAARLLLGAGADPNCWRGDPAWPNARETPLYGATGLNNFPRLARVLLMAGADPNDGESRYHAAEKNHVASLEVLKEFGTDFSSVGDAWGNTPLYFLLGWSPHMSTVRSGILWLLDNGADPNVAAYPSAAAETPLHLAVHGGWDCEMIQALLAHGANPAAPRRDGRTPHALAVRLGREDAAALLGGAAAQPPIDPADAFLGACMRGDAAAVRLKRAQYPGLVQSLDEGQRQTVLLAARAGNLEALRLMADCGMDLDVLGKDGETAVHMAAWHGQAAVLRFLIAKGCALGVRERRFGALPLGWVAHGSLHCHGENGDHAGAAAALIAAGAPLPDAFEASDAVTALLEAARPFGGAPP